MAILTHSDLDKLIACPTCDLLHSVEPLHTDCVAKCSRCHTHLISPKPETYDRTIALSVSTVILMCAALAFPFLGMSRAGLSSEASILGLAATISDGWYHLLAIFLVLFVVGIPILRTALLMYTIAPLRYGKEPYLYSKRAFSWAETLIPWSMTEIFILGTVVALVKIGGMAKIQFGVSFWLFCILVAVIAFQNASVCRWTIWQAIRKSPS